MTKITNIDALEYVIDNFNMPSEVNEKIKAILASYKKKSENRKPTTNQEENVGYKELIVEVLKNSGVPMTVTEIQRANTELGGLSNQRVSALLRQLYDADLVNKTIDKKKSYFSAI